MGMGFLWTPVAESAKHPSMQWIEAKVTFDDDRQGVIVDLIADVFYSLDAKGVVVDDPLLEPVESWAPDAVERPLQPAVTGYLPADDRLEGRRQDLEVRLSRLADRQGFVYNLRYGTVEEEDWAESWKDFFWPQKITERIVVKPTWREYTAEAGQHVIEIDPGMAFGTGTHPTTALCVRLLEDYLQPGRTVLDVGTGSGILLIAAARLGAGHLTGVDLDPMAVDVARKNLLLNRIAPAAFELTCGHLAEDVDGTWDVVVANILAEVIIDLLDQGVPAARPGGLFICSGIIEAYHARVAAKMAACGFDIVDVRKEGDWVALVGRRGP
jgi:ribosomal protein L11 methyltransferase